MSSKAKIISWDSPFKSHNHRAKKEGEKREEKSKSLVYNQLPLNDLASAQPWYSKGGGQSWLCLLLLCTHSLEMWAWCCCCYSCYYFRFRCGASVACTALQIPDHALALCHVVAYMPTLKRPRTVNLGLVSMNYIFYERNWIYLHGEDKVRS